LLIDVFTAFGLIATSFAVTNFDNLALLVSWLLGARGRWAPVFVGHLVGMGVLLLLAWSFGIGAELLPVRYVGYLGVIPIGLGLKGLYDLAREGPGGEGAPVGSNVAVRPLSIAATQIANGVDTVLVFGPLLAETEAGTDLVMVAGFVAMALLWFGLARFLEGRVARLFFLARYAHWVAPIVLIGVGLYILDNTATDVLPGE